jgi:regulatory protein
LLQKAKNYAFLLLKFRLRSENEIRQRLKKKKFDADIIEMTLSFLKDKGFIDDNYFAKTWIESRIKKPLGIRRLRAELNLKGINKAIIDTQINEIKKSYPEEDIVGGIAKDRLNKLKGIDPQKAKRRVYAYLLRRGFSPEVVIDVLNKINNRAPFYS